MADRRVKADPALSHTAQLASTLVPEPRLESLRKIYNAKKVTQAALEFVDTPGLSRTHEGNAARLALIREAGCMVLVVAGLQQVGSAHRIEGLRGKTFSWPIWRSSRIASAVWPRR